MKKKITLIIGMFYFCFSYAQDLSFTYDPAGNQIYRGPDGQSLNSTEKVVAEAFTDLIEEKEEKREKEQITISAAPNPTLGEINIFWKNLVDLHFTEMNLYTYSNQVLISRQLDSNMQEIDIDLSRYPLGTYIAVFFTNSGYTQSYKIIKK